MEGEQGMGEMSWRRGVGGVLQGITRPSGEGDGVVRGVCLTEVNERGGLDLLVLGWVGWIGLRG